MTMAMDGSSRNVIFGVPSTQPQQTLPHQYDMTQKKDSTPQIWFHAARKGFTMTCYLGGNARLGKTWMGARGRPAANIYNSSVLGLSADLKYQHVSVSCASIMACITDRDLTYH